MNFTSFALACYLAACAIYFFSAIFKRKLIGKVASAAIAIGFIFNATAVTGRWITAGRPPLSNMHESLVFIAATIAASAIVIIWKYDLEIIGALSSLAAALALGYASMLDASILPLMPALKSNWLVIHVTAYFIAYGAVTIATIASAIYLITSGEKKDALRQLDSLSFRLIAFAFPFLTIGLTTGAVWANVAWGRYWGWDPKETWSLITWLTYALYLHLRTMRGWKGKRTAIVAIAGFAAIIVTFFGVNLLMRGLHSYR